MAATAQGIVPGQQVGFSRFVDCGRRWRRLSCPEHTAAGGCLSFNHKLDRDLGEMLRRRPGRAVPVPARAMAALATAFLVATAGAWAAPAAAPRRPARARAAAPRPAAGKPGAADAVLARL